jgi:hypothetical protein
MLSFCSGISVTSQELNGLRLNLVLVGGSALERVRKILFSFILVHDKYYFI